MSGVVEKSKFFDNLENFKYIGNAMNLHENNGDLTTQGSAYDLGITKALDLFKTILPVDSNIINGLQNRVKALTDKKWSNKTFCIGTGRPVSVNQLTKLFKGLNFVYAPERKGEARHIYYDIDFARAFGYEPKVSIEKGIERLLNE